MTRTGGCYCGEVTYTLDDPTTDGIICHCKTCQKLHAGQSLNLKSTQDALKVTKGTPRSYVDRGTDSGKPITRYFCGTCASGLFSDPDSIPGVRFVKVGSLDDTSDIKLVAEIYVDTGIKAQVLPKSSQKHFEGMMAKEI